MKKQRSIRTKLVGTYFAIILITVILIEVLLYILLSNYYMSNIETIINSEVEMCSSLYQKLYYQQDFYKDSDTLGQRFAGYTKAQVYLLDLEGRVLYDHFHQYERGEKLEDSDVLTSMVNGKGASINDVDGERIYAHSEVIELNGQKVGILRLVTSLDALDEVIKGIMSVFIIAGIIIICVVLAISYILSKTIITPIRAIEAHAEAITTGDYSVRIDHHSSDEIGRLSKRLNHMAGELEIRQNLNDKFIASVSHELRTPLTSIKGWAATLKSEHDLRGEEYEDVLLEGLDIINTESDRLSILVNQLLDFSSLNIIENYENVELIPLIDECVTFLKPNLVKNNLIVNTDFEANIVIEGDRDRLKQAVLNVVDNAIKHSEGNIISISLSSIDNVVKLSIQDDGKGMSEDELNHIFDWFYSGNNPHRSGGVGLPIVKEIVEKHKGRIIVESKLGSGTMINVHLPVKRIGS